MAHLSEGTLQAYIDGELTAVRRTEVERHTGECSQCRASLAAIESEGSWAGERLGALGREAAVTPVATEVAWRRLNSVARGAPVPVSVVKTAAGASVRPVWFRRGVAAAAVAGLALLGFGLPPVRAAVGDFLSIFRVQRLQMITVSPDDLVRIQSALASSAAGVNISGLAAIRVTPADARPHTVSLDEARRLVDFDVKLPTPPPAGYALAKVIVEPAVTVHFQLHVDAINRLLASMGSTERLPASLDGQPLTFAERASAGLEYTSTDGRPPIHLAEAITPELTVPDGVDVVQVRQVLLDLPFLPASLRAQLAGISDWQHTLPVPQVAGMTEPVQVNGAQGVFMRAQKPGNPSAIVWLSGQVARAVWGQLTAEQAQAFASSMR